MLIDTVAGIGEVLGIELAASLYPNGDPVRDRAHLALLRRFRVRIAAAVRIRTEVPIPLAGDPRSGDAVLRLRDGEVLVEAETRVADVQAVERRARAKARDLGASRLVLLLSDTRHNRAMLRLHPELRTSFPVETRAALAALSRGEDPGGDCLVIL